jgi:predicted 3-demethylubiquinone-9 3-methyltransferase (glyoxalase superfamily)
VPKITTFLTFNDQAEEAVNHYVSIFNNSKVLSISRYPEGAPFPAGTAMGISFVLEGQEFTALNGGPSFGFAEGISLFVSCETQEEVDELWDRLSEGGEPGRCGWLKDRYGVSWQVIPNALGELLGDPDPQRAANVLQAMMQMSKICIADLRAACEKETAPALA